jgi:hypothetical protein
LNTFAADLLRACTDILEQLQINTNAILSWKDPLTKVSCSATASSYTEFRLGTGLPKQP